MLLLVVVKSPEGPWSYTLDLLGTRLCCCVIVDLQWVEAAPADFNVDVVHVSCSKGRSHEANSHRSPADACTTQLILCPL